MRSAMLEARKTAAAYLRSVGRAQDARAVSDAQGDDYAEVRIALLAVEAMAERTARLERALTNYADDSFWDADCSEASLAFHDRGDIARAALAGKELYAMHRD